MIERDPDIVRGLRDRGVPCLFGDAAGRRHLERASADRAALVVVALPDYEHARRVVRQARTMNATVPVLARSHHAAGSEDLVRAGATEIINPEMEAAATLIRHSLRRLAQPQDRVIAYLERFREALEGAERGREPVSGTLPRMVEVMLGPGDTRRSIAPGGADPGAARGHRGRGDCTPNGDLVLNPAAEAILRPGDRVRVFGLPAQIAAFQREAAGRE